MRVRQLHQIFAVYEFCSRHEMPIDIGYCGLKCLQQMLYNSTLFAIVTGNNGFAYFARARPEKKDWGEMNCEFASLQLPPRGAGGVESCFLVRDAG